MPDLIEQLAEQMFVGPMWPASILVCLLIVYTIFAMIGLIDFGLDVPDVDLDPGLDLDSASTWTLASTWTPASMFRM